MFECLQMFLVFEFYLANSAINVSEVFPNVFVVETKIFLVYSVVTLCCRMDILQQMRTEMILTY